MATITGNDSANTLNGTAYADTIKGLGGNDTIYGKEGDDVILGGTGNDTLYGDAGTDTVKGEDGNDIIKGGTGKAFLYGGNGDDTLFYDPTASNINAVGSYLSPSIMDGGLGIDTLNIYNNAKVTVGGVEKASMTHAYMGYGAKMLIDFTHKDGAVDGQSIRVGSESGIDVYKFHGNGGVHFQAGDEMTKIDTKAFGTVVADEFSDGYGNDTFTGGAGNDTFRLYFGGNDEIISEANDADVLYFNSGYAGGEHDTFSGFNGAGQASGDKLYFDDSDMTNPDQQVNVVNGNTVFAMDSGDTLTILGVTGLIEGVDWFV